MSSDLPTSVALVAADAGNAQLVSKAVELAAEWQLSNQPVTDAEFQLELSHDGLWLRWLAQPRMQPLQINFLQGAHADRAARASIKNEAIARAVGLGARRTKQEGTGPLRVLDATAGLGRDALVLASLGCQVSLLERQPVVAALLKDAITRLHSAHLPLADRLSFAAVGSLSEPKTLSLLAEQNEFDVVYLDPMYPKGENKRDQKSAVKKDMQMFHALVGSDEDAELLFEPALQLAKRRVVVKRPQYADSLANRQPDQQVISNKQRFDIYLSQND